MMQCPHEILFIRFVAGELDAQTAERIERHAAGCSPCAELLESTRRTWNFLDEYVLHVDAGNAIAPAGVTAQVAAESNVDLWPAVRDEVRREVRARALWFPRTPAGLLRTAASVALSVGLGWATGEWIVPNNESIADQGLGDLAEEAVIARELQPLGVDEFVTGSATGLEFAFESAADSDS